MSARFVLEFFLSRAHTSLPSLPPFAPSLKALDVQNSPSSSSQTTQEGCTDPYPSSNPPHPHRNGTRSRAGSRVRGSNTSEEGKLIYLLVFLTEERFRLLRGWCGVDRCAMKGNDEGEGRGKLGEFGRGRERGRVRASSNEKGERRGREEGRGRAHITKLNQLLPHGRIPNHQDRLPLHPIYLLPFVPPPRIAHLPRLLATLSQPIPHRSEQLRRLAFRVERVIAVVFRYQRVDVEVTVGVVRVAGRT